MTDQELVQKVASALQLTPSRCSVVASEHGELLLFVEGHRFPIAKVSTADGKLAIERIHGNHPVMEEEGLLHCDQAHRWLTPEQQAAHAALDAVHHAHTGFAAGTVARPQVQEADDALRTAMDKLDEPAKKALHDHRARPKGHVVGKIVHQL
jgi:hypothetical protein